MFALIGGHDCCPRIRPTRARVHHAAIKHVVARGHERDRHDRQSEMSGVKAVHLLPARGGGAGVAVQVSTKHSDLVGVKMISLCTQVSSEFKHGTVDSHDIFLTYVT